ncbi:hypothetical protein AVEN_15485-1 [Araneus ventricosus]|uniref:Uncharacterized protein n=1 Tax=Araneus ventricosus TaxID=182803 RepID=A0A4Y2IID2_ARAVE|nr:hypothetical protein AVEN_15485-1 [Araneus ventricosus]
MIWIGSGPIWFKLVVENGTSKRIEYILIAIMSLKAKNYRRLGQNLRRIYDAEVALEADHPSKRKVLEFILDHFKEFSFQKSQVFKQFFQEFYYTGSYFEGLRVSKATEFDINVVFKLLPHMEYMIHELEAPLSYATLQLKYPSRSSLDVTVPFFDDESYLIGKNVRSWFQSLVESFINNTNLVYPGLLEVKLTHSGPARTLKVFYNFVWISVDLVPVFAIDSKLLQKYTLEHIPVFKEESLLNCYFVPKPLKMELSCMVTDDSVERVWRIHFAETEKQILKGKHALKPLIKLMKDLRDKEMWPIPSYFLKVVAFWLVRKYPHRQFWNDSKFGLLFVKFLEALEMHLEAKHLGHILYPKFNLFHSLSPKTLMALKRRVNSIITNLDSRPQLAYKLFKVPILDHHLS